MLAACLGAAPVVVQAQIDQERAHRYFAEADSLCERDGGRLWGISLCGPMVFADAATQSIATNREEPEAKRPAAFGYANAPVDWGEERWAAFVWAMIREADKQSRGRLLMHELFHRIQPQLGLMAMGQPNDHLDTLVGRYWMQLEWRALLRALDQSGSTRVDAIRDALAFRSARRAAFPGAAENERADEIREGLAQYTGTVLAASSTVDATADVIHQLTEYPNNPTFVRTFSYPSGAAYGVLLDAVSPGWTRRIKSSDDLGQLLLQAAEIIPSEDADAAAQRYGGSALWSAEERRDAERKARVAELRRRFVDGPVLIVPRGRGAVVNTTGATPIPGEGTVFFEYRVTAEWGILESTGILQSDDGATLRLPAPFQSDGAVIKGEGWTITPAPGWLVRPGPRTGDFQIVISPHP